MGAKRAQEQAGEERKKGIGEEKKVVEVISVAVAVAAACVWREASDIPRRWGRED